jgi:hypothetical protein
MGEACRWRSAPNGEMRKDIAPGAYALVIDRERPIFPRNGRYSWFVMREGNLPIEGTECTLEEAMDAADAAAEGLFLTWEVCDLSDEDDGPFIVHQARTASFRLDVYDKKIAVFPWTLMFLGDAESSGDGECDSLDAAKRSAIAAAKAVLLEEVAQLDAPWASVSVDDQGHDGSNPFTDSVMKAAVESDELFSMLEFVPKSESQGGQ